MTDCPAMHAADTTLVVLARAPEMGQVKTRLAKGIGKRHALAVYRELLHRTSRVASAWPGPTLLSTTGNARAFLGTGLDSLPSCEQSGGGLGERIAAAMGTGLQRATAAIVIGTDCPALDQRYLDQVLTAAQGHDAGFGPTDDGGFWAMASGSERAIALLGHPNLPWSSDTTLQTVRRLFQENGLSSASGPTLADVDDAEDLERAVQNGLLRPTSTRT